MSSFAGWRVREKERVSEGECERGIFKVSPLKRLAVHVYTDQWSVCPVHRRQTGRRSLTHRKSYTLLWDGGQRLLLFLPSSCHSEVSVLRSHRLFVYALGPSIAQRAEIWSRNLNSVFVKWRNSGSKKKKIDSPEIPETVRRKWGQPWVWSDAANCLKLSFKIQIQTLFSNVNACEQTNLWSKVHLGSEDNSDISQTVDVMIWSGDLLWFIVACWSWVLKPHWETTSSRRTRLAQQGNALLSLNKASSTSHSES